MKSSTEGNTGRKKNTRKREKGERTETKTHTAGASI
jgi:hypothetical protein